VIRLSRNKKKGLIAEKVKELVLATLDWNLDIPKQTFLKLVCQFMPPFGAENCGWVLEVAPWRDFRNYSQVAIISWRRSAYLGRFLPNATKFSYIPWKKSIKC